VIDRNKRLYERYPEDRERMLRLVERLDSEDVRLADGARLTSRRVRTLGAALGMSDGAERLHYLLERELDNRFLHDVQAADPWEFQPLYVLVHEAIYCQGEASRWSAQRIAAEFPELDDPACLTGEMVYPWMLEDYTRLRPLRGAAELLAERDDWPTLYDLEVLRRNEVPVVAAVYSDDMYVEHAFSEETAAIVRGTRTWVTDEYQHDALRMHGREVLDRLLGMLDRPV
jgi:hypothetical protein